MHREKAEHELAIECYEECLRIRRSELGDLHEKVADALIAMGNVQSDMELADEAMRSYREGKCLARLRPWPVCACPHPFSFSVDNQNLLLWRT